MEVTGERVIGCHTPCDMDPLLRKRGHVTRRDLGSVTRQMQTRSELKRHVTRDVT